MSRNDKLLSKLKTKPNDFTFNELRKLLSSLGFFEDNKGKTSGSRVAFVHKKTLKVIRLDKPHPGNELKIYQINLVLKTLKEMRL